MGTLQVQGPGTRLQHVDWGWERDPLTGALKTLPSSPFPSADGLEQTRVKPLYARVIQLAGRRADGMLSRREVFFKGRT